MEEYDTLDIIRILISASILSLQSFLVEKKASWMEKNFSMVYQTSFENDSFMELQKFCTELMSKQPEKIFKSPDFISIPEKSLISLIQHDNIQMSVVQVWEHDLNGALLRIPNFLQILRVIQ